MNDEWIDLVKAAAHRSTSIKVGADDVLTRTIRLKNSLILRVWIGAGAAQRLDVKAGDGLTAQLAADGHKLKLTEDVKGTWRLKAPKRGDFLKASIAVRDVVREIATITSALYEIDEKAGSIVVYLPTAAARARAT